MKSMKARLSIVCRVFVYLECISLQYEQSYPDQDGSRVYHRLLGVQNAKTWKGRTQSSPPPQPTQAWSSPIKHLPGCSPLFKSAWSTLGESRSRTHFSNSPLARSMGVPSFSLPPSTGIQPSTNALSPCRNVIHLISEGSLGAHNTS
jgi:hypothetical protein